MSFQRNKIPPEVSKHAQAIIIAGQKLIMTDPEDWTTEEMKRWLQAVCSNFHKASENSVLIILQRGLLPNEKATRKELLERVKANLRIPRDSKPSASHS